MNLKFELDGITLVFKIKGYEKVLPEDYDYYWTTTDFSLKSKFINIKVFDQELLLSRELDELVSNIRMLIEQNEVKHEEFVCTEPDFRFRFYPREEFNLDPSYSYVRKGYESKDFHMRWEIFFWHEGLTDNYLSLYLKREEVEALYTYLKFITGIIDINDEEIKKLIKKNYLIDVDK